MQIFLLISQLVQKTQRFQDINDAIICSFLVETRIESREWKSCNWLMKKNQSNDNNFFHKAKQKVDIKSVIFLLILCHSLTHFFSGYFLEVNFKNFVKVIIISASGGILLEISVAILTFRFPLPQIFLLNFRQIKQHLKKAKPKKF